MNWIIGLALAVLAAGCATTPASPGPITLAPAIVRSGPAAEDLAAYVRITNSGAPDRLLSAECTCAARVELHNSTPTGMHVLPAIDVSAGVTDIRPGGATHLMLMQTRAAIAPNEAGRIVLVFERAGRVETAFTATENTRAAWLAAFPQGS